MRKARHRLLGLPRFATRRAKSAPDPIFAGNRQASMRHRLTATTFAPLTPTEGTVVIGGAAVKSAQTDVGIVFQDPVLLEWRTSLGNVMIQAEARRLDNGVYLPRARELLASVGLEGFEHKYPFELSGGMRQRVSLCRAL